VENVTSTAPDPAAQDQAAGSGAAAGRGPFPTAWVTGAIVLGLLLGIGAGLLIPTFLRPGESSAEAGFCRDMSSHHAQAVEMSMIAYQRATDPDVRRLAGDIALTQHGQINIMRTWLQNWHLDPTGASTPMTWMPGGAAAVRNGLMPGMATPAQITKLQGATGKDVDVQFLQLMRQHHLGGIHMAQEVIKLSDHDDVTRLAQTMVNGQQEELQVLQSLLDKVSA
jgi:uncharacterized protein (DUF305 family)